MSQRNQLLAFALSSVLLASHAVAQTEPRPTASQPSATAPPAAQPTPAAPQAPGPAQAAPAAPQGPAAGQPAPAATPPPATSPPAVPPGPPAPAATPPPATSPPAVSPGPPAPAATPPPATFSPAVSPAPSAPPPGAVRHHDGLFLQADVAIGYMDSSSTIVGVDTSIAGWSGAFSFSLGLAFATDVILAGQAWVIGSGSPTVTVGGVSSSDTGVSLSLVGYGPSFVFYFMPNNWFLSLTPSITKASLGYGNKNYDTNSGLGLRAALGKEGWLADHLAAGFGVYLFLASNPTPGATSITWGTFGLGLGMSLTLG